MRKQFTANGRAVEVTTVARPESLSFQFRAEIDGETLESTFAVGSDTGLASSNYSAEMLQRDLDAARQKLAEEAEWRARARKMMESAV